MKVHRRTLLARLEAARDEAKKEHQKALKKYASDKIKARNRASKELRRLADRIVEDTDLLVESDTVYRGGHTENRVNVLQIESGITIPRRPEEHRALSSIERAIALIDASADEKVSISTDDMTYYGIGSIAGLDN